MDGLLKMMLPDRFLTLPGCEISATLAEFTGYCLESGTVHRGNEVRSGSGRDKVTKLTKLLLSRRFLVGDT